MHHSFSLQWPQIQGNFGDHGDPCRNRQIENFFGTGKTPKRTAPLINPLSQSREDQFDSHFRSAIHDIEDRVYFHNIHRGH